jgi:hypothetical protein
MKVRTLFLHNILNELNDLFNQSRGIMPFSSWNLFDKMFNPKSKLFDLTLLNSVCRHVLVCTKFKSSHSISGNCLLHDHYATNRRQENTRPQHPRALTFRCVEQKLVTIWNWPSTDCWFNKYILYYKPLLI